MPKVLRRNLSVLYDVAMYNKWIRSTNDDAYEESSQIEYKDLIGTPLAWNNVINTIQFISEKDVVA